jgi:hypothetical protein
VGEVVGSKRPWRDGSRPLYIGPSDTTYSTAGLQAWWVSGAPSPLQPINVSNDGRKGYPYLPYTSTFPDAFGFGAATCVSSRTGPYTNSLLTFPPDLEGWQKGAFPTNLSCIWFHKTSGLLYPCVGNPYTLVATLNTALNFPHPLQCTSGSAHVQTWIDPTATVLAAGEVITITPP